MFIGLSKDIGGGFRVGVGTRLGSGSKKPSNKELQSKEFVAFLRRVEEDLNEALMIFIEGNGHNLQQLIKKKTDLDELFRDNDKYDEFITIYNNAKYEIEKILYTGDSGVVAKRAITDVVYTVKNFINREYPNVKVKKKSRGSKIFSFIWKSIVVLLVLQFIAVSISSKPHTEENQIKNEPIEKNIKIEK